MAGGIVVALMYLVALLAEFVAPSRRTRAAAATLAPPQTLHLFDDDWSFAHTSSAARARRRDGVRASSRATNQKIPVGLFVRGALTRCGADPLETHLIGPLDPSQPMYLLGTDRLGRDVLSRTIYGARVSLSIGLVGVTLALTLGMLLGGVWAITARAGMAISA
jgi:peptide/nickel transport system permease protein